ncbi:MAG: hypothetical protein ABI693_06880 [Bryobacteraceae bacterium]
MVELLVRLFLLYWAIGGMFAIAFVTAGMERVDAQARRTGVAFRMAMLPGAAVFWPLLLRRWIKGHG